jgi:hypothetical protein
MFFFVFFVSSIVSQSTTNSIREMLNKKLFLLTYLSMVERHIIFVKSKGSVFNNSTFFNTNAHSCNGDVLMNLSILNAWYTRIDNTIYVISCADIC